MRSARPPLAAVALALLIHALWGGNPAAVKLSVVAFPPLWTALLRFVLGAACVTAWALARRVRLWPTRDEWPVLGVIAGLFAVQIGTMNFGFANTTAVMGSVLIATNPIFGAVFTHLLVAHDRLTPVRAAGLAVAFAGAALVLLERAGPHDIALFAWGNWIVLGSACLLGLRLGLSARALARIEPVRVVVWQMVLSLPLFAAGALAFETVRVEAIGPVPIAAILYQGVVIAGIAFVVNFHLMRRYSPSLMLSFNFVSPVAGVALGMWILDEPAGRFLGAGLVLVAAGLWLLARPAPG